jgi:hypothetical protein
MAGGSDLIRREVTGGGPHNEHVTRFQRQSPERTNAVQEKGSVRLALAKSVLDRKLIHFQRASENGR